MNSPPATTARHDARAKARFAVAKLQHLVARIRSDLRPAAIGGVVLCDCALQCARCALLDVLEGRRRALHGRGLPVLAIVQVSYTDSISGALQQGSWSRVSLPPRAVSPRRNIARPTCNYASFRRTRHLLDRPASVSRAVGRSQKSAAAARVASFASQLPLFFFALPGLGAGRSHRFW